MRSDGSSGILRIVPEGADSRSLDLTGTPAHTCWGVLRFLERMSGEQHSVC